MKGVFIIALLLLSPVIIMANNFSDTTIQGVNIIFTYKSSIFPESWLAADINATGNPIESKEIKRTKLIMAAALHKYPEALLSRELKAVYFLKSMTIFNVGFGGTNSNDAVYLTNSGIDSGYTAFYLEQTFHHEFSSILFRNYPSLLDTVSWKAANKAGFDYNDPEAGVGAIRNNQSSQDPDSILCEAGFFTQYALSGLENDINTIAQNVFKPAGNFWEMVNRYPRIKTKVELLIKFYASLNPQFTKQYFMRFK